MNRNFLLQQRNAKTAVNELAGTNKAKSYKHDKNSGSKHSRFKTSVVYNAVPENCDRIVALRSIHQKLIHDEEFNLVLKNF